MVESPGSYNQDIFNTFDPLAQQRQAGQTAWVSMGPGKALRPPGSMVERLMGVGLKESGNWWDLRIHVQERNDY